MSKVHYIPEGFNSVTPYLVIKGAAEAIEYYKNVFGATVVVRMDGPNGTVGHAELQIGDSRIMLADENPSMGQGHTSATPWAVRPSACTYMFPTATRLSIKPWQERPRS